MAHSFNITAVIKLTIDKMLSIIILLILYTDLKSLFNYLVRLSTTQEKYLIINIIKVAILTSLRGLIYLVLILKN